MLRSRLEAEARRRLRARSDARTIHLGLARGREVQASAAQEFLRSLTRQLKSLAQRFQDRLLSLADLHERLLGIEPAGAIGLGKFRRAPGARRPFHRKAVALERLKIERALDRKGRHLLAARLLEDAERDERTVGRAA